MKSFSIVLLSVALLLFAACKKQKNDGGIKNLQGTWYETEPLGGFAGSVYTITFLDGANFEMSIQQYTDVLVPNGDSCMNGHWEFTKGKYAITSAGLDFTGNYCDGAHDKIVPNCASGTSYHDNFSFTYDGNELVLNPQEEIYYQVRLTKK